jgi:DNA-directed RNA polymerase subunit beta
LGDKINKIIKLYNEKNERNKAINTLLKRIYGEKVCKEKIQLLNNKEFDELTTNLSKGIPIATPVFDGASVDEVTKMLELADLPSSGQTKLWDGRSGEECWSNIRNTFRLGLFRIGR